MVEKFQYLQKIYGFTIVNGDRAVDDLSCELQEKVESVLIGKA